MCGKVNLPQFFQIKKKNFFFPETFTIKLPQVKILADLGEGFFGKKKGF